MSIEIVYPGGGNPHYAYRGTKPEELDSIPVMKDSYPEFSQFKELPAWGFYVRYADGITFENVHLTASENDYRPAVVIQESSNIQMKTVEFSEPGQNEKQIHTYRSSDVKITP